MTQCKWYLPCKWAKWTVRSKGTTAGSGLGGKGWPVIIQERTCENCDKLQLRSVEC
jgi:hypothetical protein